MYMKGFPFVIAVIVFSFLLTLANADYQNYNLAISPAAPTDSNVIQITVEGIWSDGCPPSQTAVSVDAGAVYFDVIRYLPENVACTQVLTPYNITKTVGPLPAGTYSICLRFLTDPNTNSEYTEAKTFTVSSSTTGLADTAQTLHVPGDYLTIQAAIDAAGDGDTIVVADGTYAGEGNRDIDFKGKAITVRSENGPENCIIDCQEEGRGFTFHSQEDPNSILDGFTITNGYAPGGQLALCNGGGIFCQNSSPSISNCILKNNDAISGSGIYCYNSNTIIRDSVIKNNAAHDRTMSYIQVGYGGGIFCCLGSIIIINSSIMNNHSDYYGGGIYCVSGKTTIENCTFSNNDSSLHGGGIHAEESILAINKCLISCNSCEYGLGGGINCNKTNVTITNCNIIANEAVEGSGLSCYESSGTITNCTIVGNGKPAKNFAGILAGGIWCGESNLSIASCVLWQNGMNWRPAITAEQNSDTIISFSDVQGGKGKCDFDDESTLIWGEGNIATYPGFVKPGYWKKSNWIEGDYHLLAGSPGIDAGDTGAIAGYDTDLDGNERVVNGTVDMGAYEYPYDYSLPGESLMISIAKLKIEKGKKQGTDFFTLAGKYPVDLSGDSPSLAEYLEDANDVYIHFGPYTQQIDAEEFEPKNGKFIYKSKNAGIQYICFQDGEFLVKGKGLDLTGLPNPIPVEIVIGDFYIQGEAEIIEGEQVPFMASYADTLEVTKAKVKAGQEVNSDTLTIEGKLAVEDMSVDLTEEEVVIGWEEQTFTLPAGNFCQKGAGKYVCKKIETAEGGVVSALINLNNSTFKIVVKKTNMEVQAGDIECSIRFGSFDETVNFSIPEK